MADEPNPQPAPPLPNAPEARTPDGTMKDAATTAPPKAPDSTLAAQPSPAPSATTPTSTTPPPAPTAPTAPTGAPEAYAAFKAPEGFEIDAKALETATPIFKDLNLSQDQAQRLVDFYAEQSKQAYNEPMRLYEETRAGWRNEIVKGPLGNGTDNLSDTTKQNIAAAINSLPADLQAPFKDAMNLTGAGDNPAYVRALNAWGARFREGTHVAGAAPAPTGQAAPGAAKSAAQLLYPNNPSSAQG